MSVPGEANSKMKHEVHYMSKKSKWGWMVALLVIILSFTLLFVLHLNSDLMKRNRWLDEQLISIANQKSDTHPSSCPHSRQGHHHHNHHGHHDHRHHPHNSELNILQNYQKLDGELQEIKRSIQRIENMMASHNQEEGSKMDSLKAYMQSLKEKTKPYVSAMDDLKNELKEKTKPYVSAMDDLKNELKNKFKNLYK